MENFFFVQWYIYVPVFTYIFITLYIISLI